jgi:hypothetical protein
VLQSLRWEGCVTPFFVEEARLQYSQLKCTPRGKLDAPPVGSHTVGLKLRWLEMASRWDHETLGGVVECWWKFAVEFGRLEGVGAEGEVSVCLYIRP